MATYQKEFHISLEEFEQFVEYIKQSILEGSSSASHEESIRINEDDIIVQVDIFERYSMFSDSRLSLSSTLIFKNNKLNIIAVTSGGSRAVLFKIDRVGEERFLNKYIQYVEDFF